MKDIRKEAKKCGFCGHIWVNRKNDIRKCPNCQRIQNPQKAGRPSKYGFENIPLGKPYPLPKQSTNIEHERMIKTFGVWLWRNGLNHTWYWNDNHQYTVTLKLKQGNTGII